MSIVIAAAVAASQPVLSYVRSNADGSEAESVIVYAEDRSKVHVVKHRDRCTSAAYVTAQLDPATGQALSLTGGRLTRELSQQPLAYFTAAAGRAQARLGSPDAAPLFDVAVGPRWFLYDFDLSDWVAHPPAAIGKREDFAQDMVLLLTPDDGEPTMTNRGPLRMRFAGTGTAPSGDFVYYVAQGPALDGGSGAMWFDAADGRLIAARLPLANHAGYSDFAYRLVDRAEGADAWRAALSRHWKGCPPPRG